MYRIQMNKGLMRILFLSTIVSCSIALSAQNSSTFPLPDAPKYERDLSVNMHSNLITFNEFPVGPISNEYQANGIIFSGSGPKIINDGSNSTTPVLSGTPTLLGDMTGTFMMPGSTTPGVVNSFMLDAGFFNAIGETTLAWYDINGNLIGSVTNTQLGIETFAINAADIASWNISATVNEGGGFAIDNLSFDEPVAFSGELTSSIPTMGEWGLICLFLLLLVVGVIGAKVKQAVSA